MHCFCWLLFSLFFSLFLVLLLLCCFSCCSSLSPFPLFVLLLCSHPAKLQIATCVQQMFTVPIRSIHQLSELSSVQLGQFRDSSKDFQNFEVLLEGGTVVSLNCRGDDLWWLPLQGTRSEEIMDVDLQ